MQIARMLKQQAKTPINRHFSNVTEEYDPTQATSSSRESNAYTNIQINADKECSEDECSVDSNMSSDEVKSNKSDPTSDVNI